MGDIYIIMEEQKPEFFETESYKKKPSPFYCKTGYLDIEIGEQFDKELHNFNKKTILDRALGFYSEIEIIDMQIEMKNK